MKAEIKCPQCKKPVTWQGNPDRPFCSERCRLIDLGCWADESYRVAGKVAFGHTLSKEWRQLDNA